MYIISNTDMKQAIEYIEMMIQELTDTDLETYNKKRMASILLRKLRAKLPLPTDYLSDDLKKRLRQK